MSADALSERATGTRAADMRGRRDERSRRPARLTVSPADTNTSHPVPRSRTASVSCPVSLSPDPDSVSLPRVTLRFPCPRRNLLPVLIADRHFISSSCLATATATAPATATATAPDSTRDVFMRRVACYLYLPLCSSSAVPLLCSSLEYSPSREWDTFYQTNFTSRSSCKEKDDRKGGK